MKILLTTLALLSYTVALEARTSKPECQEIYSGNMRMIKDHSSFLTEREYRQYLDAGMIVGTHCKKHGYTDSLAELKSCFTIMKTALAKDLTHCKKTGQAGTNFRRFLTTGAH